MKANSYPDTISFSRNRTIITLRSDFGVQLFGQCWKIVSSSDKTVVMEAGGASNFRNVLISGDDDHGTRWESQKAGYEGHHKVAGNQITNMMMAGESLMLEIEYRRKAVVKNGATRLKEREPILPVKSPDYTADNYDLRSLKRPFIDPMINASPLPFMPDTKRLEPLAGVFSELEKAAMNPKLRTTAAMLRHYPHILREAKDLINRTKRENPDSVDVSLNDKGEIVISVVQKTEI